MTIQELLRKYQESQNVRFLSKAIASPGKNKILLSGLTGSADAVIAAALQQLVPHPALYIAGDKEEAAYFQNNLENLLGQNKVLFFPASYKKTFSIDQIDNNSVLQRAEVLTRISKATDHFMIVSYPEAIVEKVVTKRTLERNTMEATKGEKLSISFLTEFMEENGFDRTEFVYEPGQYAVRGGIIDVYSFAHEMPFRIELENDTIESIRTFDPSTQLSETMMAFVTIIPNVQKGLVREEHQSFFDFIPENTVIYARNLEYISVFIKNSYAEIQKKYGESYYSEEQQAELKLNEVFDTAEHAIDRINAHRVIEHGEKNHFRPDETYTFHMSPPTRFNKNFDLLLIQLFKDQQEKYSSLIFSDSPKQTERIYSIFEDIEKPAEYKGKQLQFSVVNTALHEGFIDHDLKFACYTDHQIFDRYHRFRLKKNYSKSEAITLKDLYSLKPGDFVTHIDHGVGRFAGLETMEVNGKQQESIRLVYKDNDVLYISIHSLHRIARFTGKEGTSPTLNKLGSTAWSTLKLKTKKKVKDIAKDLIELYAKRKAQKGFAFTKDTYMQTELEASFIYEDTPDQVKSTRDFKKDMERDFPMDRLICGDVGFGKTEIAIRAAFKAVCDGKQVAVLVPTTILALQHWRTFTERLKDFPCTIDYINRFKSPAQQKITIEKLKSGKIDIVIGTHRILSKDIVFKDLGLFIIDEEQKFGVAAKEKIKAVRINVDTLTLTATPIPRTLQFSLMGARDLSVINTPPPNRYPVSTEVHSFNRDLIKEVITYEVSRGGQVFFIHNKINDIHEMADLVRSLCPGVRVDVGHGQMDGDHLEDVLMKFIEGDTDVLISTTIVESGLDISNANTIIINNAHYFGLSDLHQMRGRVGRSNKKAFCYLLAPPLTVLTPEARQRLKAIEEHAELGSGFNVAMRDLDIRGAGNLLGGEQSGFISEIGYEMYQKILDEALQELRETDFKGLFPEEENKKFVNDCQIDTDMEMRIPDDYVNSISERLNLYKELDEIETEEKLKEYEVNMRDRFGPLPPQVYELMNTIRLRWKAREIGFEKIVMKNMVLKGYFIINQTSGYFQSPKFAGVLQYVQANPRSCKMKEEKGKLSLTFNMVRSVEDANNVFAKILSAVNLAQTA
jgi:transcription-repair coupling factor (superfamily II helicase)